MLEIGGDEHTRAHSGDRVDQSDIFHYAASHAQATVVGESSSCEPIPDTPFDGIIMTRSLQVILDVRGASRDVHRLPKPGGSLIATFRETRQISAPDWRSTWSWGWSSGQAERLVRTALPAGGAKVETLGNRFAAIAMLQGVVAEAVPREELLLSDGGSAFPIGAVAVRGTAPGPAPAC